MLVHLLTIIIVFGQEIYQNGVIKATGIINPGEHLLQTP